MSYQLNLLRSNKHIGRYSARVSDNDMQHFASKRYYYYIAFNYEKPFANYVN